MGSLLSIPVDMLGQSGCKLTFPNSVIYLDPYLSNSVQELDAPDLERLSPIPFSADRVVDAQWVLITHDHLDHCDPKTLPKLAAASPDARFIGPPSVLSRLATWGIEQHRLVPAEEDWIDLGNALSVRAIPAAHPEIQRDSSGRLSCVGYLVKYNGKNIYFAGDTNARQEIIDCLVTNGPIHTAFLPVNEHNFFRGRRGILGNMSVREAFQFAIEIAAQQVVPVHWDMFRENSVDPDEILLIHKRLQSPFRLLLRPTVISLSEVHVSLIVRTLNEARHLGDLLSALSKQQAEALRHEVIIVDSGSTDATLDIARRHDCHIHHVKRSEFSFGRSLNVGCAAARGNILVIISGHCVPYNDHWLMRLCQPILNGSADYTYGRQIGGEQTRYSESRIFAKFFPDQSQIPQEGFFCNNANAAISRSAWENNHFDEELTGLEDMALAQKLARDGGKLAYVADAKVYHYHHESWSQIRRRFEREAIALQKIMPHIHIGPLDLVRYIVSSIVTDFRHAFLNGVLLRNLAEILLYRTNQYMGTFKGNNEHRRLSHAEKEKYFYPQ